MLSLMEVDDQWYVVQFTDYEGNEGYTERIYDEKIALAELKNKRDLGFEAKLYYSIELSMEMRS